MSILETNKQFYDNILLNPSPLFQFVGSTGKTINDAFKTPIDTAKKEIDQLKKEGVKAYANNKAGQAKVAVNAVRAANQSIVKDPVGAVKTTGKFITDNTKEAIKKAVNNPAAVAGNVVGEAALMALPIGGIGKVSKGVSKGITKITPSQYPVGTVLRNTTDFPEAKPILRHIEDLKRVDIPKIQTIKEGLTDINSLKKHSLSKGQPKIDEQLYEISKGDLRKVPSDIEQIYLEQYKKYPAEMLEANPTRSTNTRLLTDWAEGVVGRKDFSKQLRGEISQGLRRNSLDIPIINMGEDAGRAFNREVFKGADPYKLYLQNDNYKLGSMLGVYKPLTDTIDVANKKYAQAIIDFVGAKMLPEATYPHEVTHKVITNLEKEAFKNPSNARLNEKINEMRAIVGEPRNTLGGSEALSNALPAALNPKFQAQIAPYYGTGKLNDMQVLRDTENWWRKELAPYALKREESLFKGSNLAIPQNSRDRSLSEYMKVLDDEQYLKRMEDLQW